MLKEFKKQMWNDGPAKQPWLNYFNEYELQHCCFGSDGNGENGDGTHAEISTVSGKDHSISGREGEDKTAEQERDEEAAAAAAAAASAAAAATDETVDTVGSPNTGPAATDGFDISFGPNEEGRLPGDEYDPEQDFHVVTDPNTGMTSVKAGTGKDVTDEVGYNDLVDLGFFDKLDTGIKDFDKKQADALNREFEKEYGPGRAVVSVDDFGNYTYTGADKWSALGGQLAEAYGKLSPAVQLGKTIDELGGLSGLFGKAKDSLVSAFSRTPSTSQTLSRLAGSDKDLSGLAGIGEFSPSAAQTAIALGTSPAQTAVTTLDPSDIGMAWSREPGRALSPDDLSYAFAAQPGRALSPDDLSYAFAAQPGRALSPDDIGMAWSREPGRALSPDDIGMAWSREPGRALSPDDLSYAFAAQPSEAYSLGKYSLGPKTETEADRRRDILEKVRAEIEEERRQANLAAVEDMLKYRSAGGMVYRNEGGQAKEKSAMELYLEKLGQPSKYTVPDFPMNIPSMVSPPATSDPFELAEYRKNLARETMGNYLPIDTGGASSAINTFNENYYGGASNVSPYNVAQLASLYGLPRDAGTYEGIIGMLGGVRNEPPPPPPVVPDPEPEPVIVEEEDDDNWSMYDEEEIDQAFAKGGGGIRDVLYRQTGGAATYDPVREAEAERRARELQARKIAELDTAPQTRAEREALQAKGGFYRDEEGAVRDAMGNIQEDFGFDYVAPPEPGRPDPVNTPDTPAPEPEPEPFKLDTTPLPPGLVRNPETGEVTIDKEAAKGYAHRGGWQIDRAIEEQGIDEDKYINFDEQDYLRNVFMEGYEDTKLPRGQLGGGWTIERSGGREGYPNAPEMYNYALKGPDVLQPPKPGDPIYQPMIGQQQLQPTGLQGLQQGMQNPNYIPPSTRPLMQSQNMQGLGQNLQGFGMQSPVPFGTQQPFSSGFGGFGQQ
jgi:hypothetical protein